MSAMVSHVPWLEERVSIRRFTKELEDVGGTGTLYGPTRYRQRDII
jgi:hypothetical protein